MALVHSERVDSPDGRRVQVLFYDDGSYRFRVYETPLSLTEAYLQGGRNDHAIIKVVPLARGDQPIDDHEESLDEADKKSYKTIRVNVFRNKGYDAVQLASPRDQGNFRANFKPDSYLGKKLQELLDK
jgi:hypothetical protein